MNEKVAEMKDRMREALELRGKKSNDLVTDLEIPASAISQYLNGKSRNMSVDRLGAICRYLDVNEPWMMGYDVTRERMTEEKNAIIADAVDRMRRSPDFLKLNEILCSLEDEKIFVIKQMLLVLLEDLDD